jgi:hypothetical protein
MTAAGVWALGLARMAGVNQINMQLKNIDSIDPIYSGLNWLRGHYSVTQNPVNYYWGGESFKYYYLWTIAKTWEIMGQETVAGHNWYAELISHLDSVQSSDGHWPGTGSEEPNALATEWAILSIEVPIVPQTVLENSKLKAILNSGADLHIYDQQGRHVGYNYTTQQNEIQIPGATYTGRESEPQIITIPLTEGLKFTMEVVGTTGGPYELVVDLTTYDVVVAERSFSGTTSPGVVFPYSVEAVTVAGLSLFVQPPISLATTLEIGTLATSGQYSDPVALSATLKEFATSSPISGKTISFTIGTQTATGTTNTSGVATVSINLNQPSGAYTVTASFAGDSTYQSSSDSKPFTIDKENVAITYTGNTLVFTAGPTISTAPVHLATHLVQESDGYPGDLTLASVTFALFRSSNFGSIPDLTYDASVDSAGDAHYDVASLAADVWTVRVTVKSGNLYWTQTLEGLGILVVSLPGLSATGGGWIPDSGSANGKDNFGFTVQYNKNQAPKGNFVFVLRGKDGYDYVVKSNSWQGGGLSFTGTNKVYFSGKCNVQKIDKTTGAVVASWGNYRFAVDITDGDLITPHTTDTIAIRILNSINAIWQQIGTSTAQIPLGGGNIVIHSK